MTDERTEAEKAVMKELGEQGVPPYRYYPAWKAAIAAAVRRELKLRAYQRAVKEIEGACDRAENRLLRSWFKSVLAIIHKHTTSESFLKEHP